jgi:DNA-binding LytR/AlgR family response regulator
MYEKTLTSSLDFPFPIQSVLAKLSRIAIKAKGRILFIDPSEIMTVEAQGNYVLLRRKTGSDLLRESMSVTADKLRPYGFVRIHRSVTVNAAFVEEIQTLPSGDHVLRVAGGMEFTVSRKYRKNLHAITPLWIGTSGFQKSKRKPKTYFAVSA